MDPLARSYSVDQVAEQNSDFIITEVRAIGLKSLCSFGHGVSGIRLIWEVFQSEGTVCVSMDAWKIACQTGAS